MKIPEKLPHPPNTPKHIPKPPQSPSPPKSPPKSPPPKKATVLDSFAVEPPPPLSPCFPPQ